VAVRAWLRLPAKGPAVVLAMAICFLPFLHVRFIPISLVLAVAALLRLRRAARPAAMLFVALCLLGGAGFVAFYVSTYGSPFGNAQYAYLSPDPVNWSRFPALAMGLLWEREVGILPVAPVLVLGIIGAAAALVERDRRMLLAVALTVIYTLVVALALAAGLADWGWSLPWRFVLPITPVMALLGFHAAHQYRIIRWLAVPLLGAGRACFHRTSLLRSARSTAPRVSRPLARSPRRPRARCAPFPAGMRPAFSAGGYARGCFRAT
jgi:hypothetical protein